MRNRHHIEHTTIQIEKEPRPKMENPVQLRF
jgi:hypothetical protein